MRKIVAAICMLGALTVGEALAANPKQGEPAARPGRPEGSFLDQVFGVRISNVVADPDTLEVTFDVTEFMSSSYPYTTAYLGAYTPFFFNNLVASAITYGDGSYLPPLQFPYGIPFLATSTLDTVNGGTGVFRVYRGSFSHTYPGQGEYTLQANSFCCAASPANTVTDGGVLTTIYTYNYPPYVFTYRIFYDTTVIDLTPQSILEIPTVSTAGLVALGLALLAAGFVVLRRS